MPRSVEQFPSVTVCDYRVSRSASYSVTVRLIFHSLAQVIRKSLGLYSYAEMASQKESVIHAFPPSRVFQTHSFLISKIPAESLKQRINKKLPSLALVTSQILSAYRNALLQHRNGFDQEFGGHESNKQDVSKDHIICANIQCIVAL